MYTKIDLSYYEMDVMAVVFDDLMRLMSNLDLENASVEVVPVAPSSEGYVSDSSFIHATIKETSFDDGCESTVVLNITYDAYGKRVGDSQIAFYDIHKNIIKPGEFTTAKRSKS